MTIPDSLLDMEWVKVNIFIYIKKKAGKAGQCDISMAEIAYEFNLTRATASRYVHELEKLSCFSFFGHQTSTKRTLISFKTNALSNTNGHQTDTKRTKEERKKAFTEALRPYLEKYGRDMLNDFFQYWTQSGENDAKMYFEKQKTFQIPNRLALWHSKNKNNIRNGNHKQSAAERQRADLASAAETFARLDAERRASLGDADT